MYKSVIFWYFSIMLVQISSNISGNKTHYNTDDETINNVQAHLKDIAEEEDALEERGCNWPYLVWFQWYHLATLLPGA